MKSNILVISNLKKDTNKNFSIKGEIYSYNMKNGRFLPKAAVNLNNAKSFNELAF